MAAADSGATVLASLPQPRAAIRPAAVVHFITSRPCLTGSRMGKGGLRNDTSVRKLRCREDVTACEKGKQKGAKEKKPQKSCARSSLFPQRCLALCRGFRDVNTSCLHLPSRQ